ncbi:unnamed protein product [Dovyalis caffra]|uniref:Secreted protein n=1 Tax=Dovyalis caffra TaxID=77055 RepID=A0AAV1R3P1_9ROSI|nr:unnamed protein product [Dovyalis caffra]
MFIFPACLVNVSLPLAFLSCTKEQFRFLLRTQAKELNKGRPQRKLADGWVDKAVKVGLACFVRSARTVLAFKAQVGRLGDGTVARAGSGSGNSGFNRRRSN